MEKIGVEAVVEGLASFSGDMKKIDSLITGLVPGGHLLGDAFTSLGNIVSGLVDGALRVLEFTLGQLIADAIEAVIALIQQLISDTVDLANELQTLSVRLTGMNLPQSQDQIENWDQAMKDATASTQDQLEWIQELGVASPFPPGKIAELYTAARAMGYADDAARELTQDVLEFTAWAGGGADVMDRVILNLRQMGTRGKVTGREMSDLARGALLPLEDILGRMAEKMGISTEELNKLISSAEGVDPQLFVEAFQEMVNEEPRFVGAMGRLARTFQAAKENFMQLLQSLGASQILTPIFDALGESIASITDQFVSFDEAGNLFHTEKWEQAKDAAKGVGVALADVVSELIELGPGAAGIADGIVKGLQSVASWLTRHKDDIVRWVKSAATWITTKLIPAIQQLISWLFGTEREEGAIQRFGEWLANSFVPAIMEASKWVGEVLVPFLRDDLFPTISELIPLAQALGAVLLTAITGTEPNTSLSLWIHEELIPGIRSLTKFVEDNRDTIAKWVKAIALVWAAMLVAAAAIGAVIQAVVFLTSVVAGLVFIFIGALGLMFNAIGTWVLGTIIKLQDWKNRAVGAFAQWAADTHNKIAQWIVDARSQITNWASQTISIFQQWAADVVQKIKNAFASANWSGIVTSITNALINYNWFGIGVSIIEAIIAGFTSQSLPPPSTSGGGDSGGCFIAGTKVAMADGSFKAIEELVVGDMVLSRDLVSKADVPTRVVKLFHHIEDPSPMYLIFNRFLRVTPEHSMYVNGDWQWAGRVKVGDFFTDLDGNKVEVTSIEIVRETNPVYNIHVEHEAHNYFADGILVHNAQKFASGTGGKWLTVPEGFMNDKFPISLSSGEKFAVLSRGESAPSVPASSTVNSSQQIINNLQLIINSSAKSEPIVQDFAMMKSLVGQS